MKKQKYNLLNIGYYKAPRNAKINPRVIPEAIEYIELITGGYVYFQPQGYKTEIKFGCGTMFWHIHGDYTVYKADKEEPYECLCITFNSHKNKKRNYPHVSLWRNPDEAIYFSDTIHHAFHSNLMSKIEIQNYILAKLTWEAQLFEKRKLSLNIPDNMQNLWNFIKQQFPQNISIAKLASIAEVSPAHLHVICKKYFGKTPHEILLDRRLSEARKILLKTKTPIKEISQLCGFTNIETFYRAFNRKFKITPAKMRLENDPKKFLLS
ncbi:MAG TPA: helix-turn-helix transcriptional regulator, partial [Victivallales bacterium]|nr:helix-turn-helix transcriptional regulator [Victivallales bacterium]